MQPGVFKPSETFSQFIETAANADSPPILHIRHQYSSLAEIEARLARPLYSEIPWHVYQRNGSLFFLHDLSSVYKGIRTGALELNLRDREAIWHIDERQSQDSLHQYVVNRLTDFCSDQIILLPFVHDTDAMIFHSSACILDGSGLAFLGHSGAGKSTIAEILAKDARVLSDDRNLLRCADGGWFVEGTWIHGSYGDIHPGVAPLRRVFFLEQSPDFYLIPVKDRMERFERLLVRLARSFVPEGWWEIALDRITPLIDEPIFYRLGFSPQHPVADLLREHLREEG